MIKARVDSEAGPTGLVKAEKTGGYPVPNGRRRVGGMVRPDATGG